MKNTRKYKVSEKGKITLKPSERFGDIKYVEFRNSKIREAMNIANKKMRQHTGMPQELRASGHKEGGDYNHCFWTEHFHAAMKILTTK